MAYPARPNPRRRFVDSLEHGGEVESHRPVRIRTVGAQKRIGQVKLTPLALLFKIYKGICARLR
jgi:hypothetical protein